MVAVPDSGAAIFQDDFSSDPSTRGWHLFGDSSLFEWNVASGHLEVTWDSSRSNSYFYHRLGTVLSKSDDFSLQFDLRLESIMAGVNPEKPSTFEIAAGFIHLASATHPDFNRGTGRDSPNLVEFDYFPAADIIDATVSPAIVSSNNQFKAGFNYPLPLTAGDLYQIRISYTASNQTLVTAMTRNGSPFGPVGDLKLSPDFTDFQVDAVSINSYNDSGDLYGSILARGSVDDLIVVWPEAPIGEIVGRFTNQIWQVEFATRTNWLYTLERTADFRSWTAILPTQSGNGGKILVRDTNAPAAAAGFYRVRAQKL
jgi:hypothetical protein